MLLASYRIYFILVAMLGNAEYVNKHATCFYSYSYSFINCFGNSCCFAHALPLIGNQFGTFANLF